MNPSKRKQQLLFRFVCVGFVGTITIALLYFFGWITFTNPETLLRSSSESDRFDALITIAEQGHEGSHWRSKVIKTLQTDPSPDIREMATITLRELGKSEASISALESCLLSETNTHVITAIQETIEFLTSE